MLVVFIASNYDVAKRLVYAAPKAIPNISFCGIEVEWGNKQLDTNIPGIDMVLNHHGDNENTPASLVYKKIYDENTIQNYHSENFIISHLDADTIFGIGWVSGFFNYNKEMIDLSNLIAEMDIKGYHNLDIPEEYIVKFEVVMSIVSHAKNSLKKVKFKNYYNCTPIILKTLNKICTVLGNNFLLNKRYNLIMKEKISKVILAPRLSESDNEIHIYDRRINDFSDGDHSFIIIWNITLSIYGRNDEIVKKYIPEGLPTFLSNIMPGSGGQFSAAGTKRKKPIKREDYLKIIRELKLRINEVKKYG